MNRDTSSSPMTVKEMMLDISRKSIKMQFWKTSLDAEWTEHYLKR